jgi:Lrp/AsnC family leucine-responsive transcriptional regulator
LAQESCDDRVMSEENGLDAIDRRILQAMQAQGRITYDDLASLVGLSGSAALRRVRRLEDTGVITGYGARVNPERVGLALTAYLSVRLAKHTPGDHRSPMDAFAAAVQSWPEVVECAALTGEMDYLLRVVVRDIEHCSRFIMDTLLRHPAVQDCKTSFVLRQFKGPLALPL